MLDDWSLNYDGNFILIGCICWYGWPVMAETVYTGGVCLVKCGRYLGLYGHFLRYSLVNFSV